MTLHTSSGCTIAGGDELGQLTSKNCAYNPITNDNTGCSVTDESSLSYGDGFNDNDGGYFAMEWTNSWIRVWFFPNYAVPASITSGEPDVSMFGTPSANFQGSCDIEEKFALHNIIFNIDFCGDGAGYTFGDTTCPQSTTAENSMDSCIDFVGNNPQEMSNAYWQIRSLQVYQQLNGGNASAPSSPVPSVAPVSVSHPNVGMGASPTRSSSIPVFIAPSSPTSSPSVHVFVTPSSPTHFSSVPSFVTPSSPSSAQSRPSGEPSIDHEGATINGTATISFDKNGKATIILSPDSDYPTISVALPIQNTGGEDTPVIATFDVRIVEDSSTSMSSSSISTIPSSFMSSSVPSSSPSSTTTLPPHLARRAAGSGCFLDVYAGDYLVRSIGVNTLSSQFTSIDTEPFTPASAGNQITIVETCPNTNDYVALEIVGLTVSKVVSGSSSRPAVSHPVNSHPPFSYPAGSHLGSNVCPARPRVTVTITPVSRPIVYVL